MHDPVEPLSVLLARRARFLAVMAVVFFALGLFGQWVGLEPYWHPFGNHIDPLGR